jgi:Domain of unknown function (DUF4160)
MTLLVYEVSWNNGYAAFQSTLITMAPLLSEIHGVRILVYSREHLPPHVHVVYGEDEAILDIRTGMPLKGVLPTNKLRLIQAWLNQDLNRESAEESFYQLNPKLRKNDRT